MLSKVMKLTIMNNTILTTSISINNQSIFTIFSFVDIFVNSVINPSNYDTKYGSNDLDNRNNGLTYVQDNYY